MTPYFVDDEKILFTDLTGYAHNPTLEELVEAAEKHFGGVPTSALSITISSGKIITLRKKKEDPSPKP